MNERHRWERLIGLMEQERDLLDEFTERSGEMRSALHRRDWTALDNTLKKLDVLAGRIESAERKRDALAVRIRGDQIAFEKRIAELPPETRERFREVRSDLRARLATVRSRAEGIVGYAESRSRLAKEIMEELVPSTRGRMYDSRGRSASAGRDPIVVSRHL